jgi:hypothetical protein
MDILESDWKLFKHNLPVWRENYLAKINKEIVLILSDKNMTDTEKFWKVKETIDNKAEIMKDCFDDTRRTMMLIKMMMMYKNKIINMENISGFSKDVAENVKAFNEISKEV